MMTPAQTNMHTQTSAHDRQILTGDVSATLGVHVAVGQQGLARAVCGLHAAGRSATSPVCTPGALLRAASAKRYVGAVDKALPMFAGVQCCRTCRTCMPQL